MKSPKPHFTDIKTVAFIVALVGLVLVSGFISSKTLLTDPPAESPQPLNVNASPSRPTANANNGEPRGRSDTPDVMVWVNTNSGVYHCPNTQWYGNTKSGKYMTQREAQAKGYRPAYGAVCGYASTQLFQSANGPTL